VVGGGGVQGGRGGRMWVTCGCLWPELGAFLRCVVVSLRRMGCGWPEPGPFLGHLEVLTSKVYGVHLTGLGQVPSLQADCSRLMGVHDVWTPPTVLPALRAVEGTQVLSDNTSAKQRPDR
jgi:hypothetical protein